MQTFAFIDAAGDRVATLSHVTLEQAEYYRDCIEDLFGNGSKLTIVPVEE